MDPQRRLDPEADTTVGNALTNGTIRDEGGTTFVHLEEGT